MTLFLHKNKCQVILLTNTIYYRTFSFLIKCNINYRIANIITLVIVKILAFICNKRYVFQSKCQNKRELIDEIVLFLISRFVTFLIDYYGLIILTEKMFIEKIVGKIIMIIVVSIINYFLGKNLIFKNKKRVVVGV